MPDDAIPPAGRSAASGGPPASERLEATVIGAVQGVGYRWFVLQAATRLELCGWVANRTDGAVVCAVEGPRSALEALLNELARGPMGAQVDRVIPAWMIATGRFSRFEIRSGSHPGD